MTTARVTIEGKRYVLIEEAEYRRLRKPPGPDKRNKTIRTPDGRTVETVDALAYARKSIGRHVHRLRMKTGMGQVELATAAGVRPETISRIERGIGNPTTGTIEKLVRAMGLDPETA